ncbi:MAG: metallophosphoesterase [Bryobacteraceae bacterium]|nr:metallophosphoesterase [Bryobacteraceae bacterium]
MPHIVSRRSFLGIGASLLAPPLTPRLRAKLSDIELSFVHVTDSHVSRERLLDKRRGFDVPAEESIRRCRAAVEAINDLSLPHEFIVHTGDVAHTRETNDDFDLGRELHQFRKPAWYVPGNHDVGYSQSARFRPAFEERFGKAYQAFEPVPGLRFVMFDSQPLDPRAGEKDQEEAFRQLDRLLSPSKPTIFCCHVTGLASFYLNKVDPGWPEAHLARWTRRLKEGGVIAVLAGHYHREEFQIVNDVPFWLAGPVINFWGRQTSFRHVTLSRGMLSYRSVYLEL